MNLSLAHAMSHWPRKLAALKDGVIVMAMNRIQFQRGMSLPEFMHGYGTEEQCAETLRRVRWPDGFSCPRCGCSAHYVVGHGVRELFQCNGCQHQASLTAGSLLASTKLLLRTWLLAVDLISQAKTALSALTLKRHLGDVTQSAEGPENWPRFRPLSSAS